MNINFTIQVPSFKKAASVEEMLKAQGITYAVRVDDKPSLGSGRRTVKRIGKDELAAVLLAIDNHPKWSLEDIAKSTGVHPQAVGKINRGIHPLQKANGAVKSKLQAAGDTL